MAGPGEAAIRAALDQGAAAARDWHDALRVDISNPAVAHAMRAMWMWYDTNRSYTAHLALRTWIDSL